MYTLNWNISNIQEKAQTLSVGEMHCPRVNIMVWSLLWLTNNTLSITPLLPNFTQLCLCFELYNKWVLHNMPSGTGSFASRLYFESHPNCVYLWYICSHWHIGLHCVNSHNSCILLLRGFWCVSVSGYCKLCNWGLSFLFFFFKFIWEIIDICYCRNIRYPVLCCDLQMLWSDYHNRFHYYPSSYIVQ